MIQNPREALEFIRRHRIVTMTRSEGHPSFVDAVVGRPVKGSWWAHDQGGHIFRLAETVLDSREVLSLKLVQGKVTFVHEVLWPLLCRVVTDPTWRKARRQRLTPDAAELLRVVERRGSVRLDEWASKGRTELEPTLLVHSGSVHTGKGSHTTVFTSWKRIFSAATVQCAESLTLKESQERIGLA